jgi:ABC-type sulfate transport system permease component
MLLHFVMIFWPLLLASPFVFLIKKVRKTSVLRVAALIVVCGSYVMLLFAVPAVIGAWIMVAADNPANSFVTNVIDRDQMFAGIQFPKGSTKKG